MTGHVRNRLLFTALALTLGSVWASYNGTVESVHFYAHWRDGNAVDFGQLPQQLMTIGANELARRAGTDYAEDFAPDGDSDRVSPARQLDTSLLRSEGLNESADGDAAKIAHRLNWRARDLEVKGDLRGAVRLYFQADPDDSESFVRTRSDLLAASRGKNSPALQRYLRATFLEKFAGKPADSALMELANQRDLPSYLKAFLRDHMPDPAIEPDYKSAKELLQAPHDASDAPEAGRQLRAILAAHPSTPKKGDIFGWLARSEYLQKHYDRAIGYYQDQLNLQPGAGKKWIAHHSLYIVYGAKGLHDRQVETLLGEWLDCPDADRHVSAGMLLRNAFYELSAEQAKSLQHHLRRDPALLSAYLGFRIEDTQLTPSQERGLYRFAFSALDGLHKRPPLLLLRVGQASYNAGLYSNALRLADQTLASSNVPIDLRQRSQYLRAGSLARLGRSGAAISQYRSLLRTHPRRYLRQSAQEHLALLEERYGDPAAALPIYRELGYDWDYAYLADVKLTPAQLATAISRAPAGETRNVLLYTLGMRYARLEQYDRALAVWHRLSTLERFHFGLTDTHFAAFKKAYADGNYFDEFPRLPDPLLTTEKLRRWQVSASHGTSEKRAQALYLAASYIYDHRCLLLYSPGLWEFGRSFALGYENWSDTVNDRKDVSARYRHMYDHECYSQALRYCKRIVEKYPHSSIMPKALYTGAIASDHLIHMSEWWRHADRNAHLDLAARYMETLAARYPHDPLAANAKKYGSVFRDELAQKDWGG